VTAELLFAIYETVCSLCVVMSEGCISEYTHTSSVVLRSLTFRQLAILGMFIIQ